MTETLKCEGCEKNFKIDRPEELGCYETKKEIAPQAGVAICPHCEYAQVICVAWPLESCGKRLMHRNDKVYIRFVYFEGYQGT